MAIEWRKDVDAALQDAARSKRPPLPNSDSAPEALYWKGVAR